MWWTRVPEELNEWISWADRLGVHDLYYKDDFIRASNCIDGPILNELGAFYSRAIREKHMPRLEAWITTMSGTVPMDPREKRLRNLARVFAYIGRRACQPFSSHELKFQVPATPDWSKLPKELEFLARPAAECVGKFHPAFSEAGRGSIQKSATELQRNLLVPVAEQVRCVGFNTVKEWYTRLGLWEHVEASLVFELMGILDAMELKYFD